MQAVVRRRRLTGAVQSGEFGRADFFGAGSPSQAPAVLHPAVLTGAAGGRQEALGHSDILVSKRNLLLPVHHTCSRGKPKASRVIGAF